MRPASWDICRSPGTRRRGWTLLELTIALAVLALLAGIAVPLYQSYVERARVAEAVVDIRTIEAAIDYHRTEFRGMPSQLDHVMDEVPTDPWGNPYRYLRLDPPSPGSRGAARKDKNLVPLNTDYDLYSAGADGQSRPPLTAKHSRDDVVRANDGGYVGLGIRY